MRSYICVLMMSYIGGACSAVFGTALTGRRNPLPVNVTVLCVCMMNNTTTHAVVRHQADETGSPVLPGASACANNAVYRRTTPTVMRDFIMSCDRSAGRTHVHTGAVPCRFFSHSDDQLVICYPSHCFYSVATAGRNNSALPAALARSVGGTESKGSAVNGREQLAPTIGKWVAACFPGGTISSEGQIQELVQEAADAARSDYGVESALEWANGYTFPPGTVDSDMACLVAAKYDFEVMVRERLESLSANRLSAKRVERLREDNPERVLLMDLVVGMKVHVPEEFQPNGHQPRSDLRDIYVEVAPAVNKMLGAVIADRLAFLLPLDMALQYVPNLHLSKAHWCPKKGKASGRPLSDLSNVDGTRINTDATAKAATDYYGAIRHPTIEDIARMVHEFWLEAKSRDPRLRQQDLRLWKMDLRGAYTLVHPPVL